MATKTLFVGNLPYTLSTTDFLGHFEKFGASNARIIEGRGFGFIDVDAEQMADAITATNMKDLGGRQIAVNEAQPKGSSSSRPGGGGGSYSGGGGGGRSSGGSSRSSSSRW